MLTQSWSTQIVVNIDIPYSCGSRKDDSIDEESLVII